MHNDTILSQTFTSPRIVLVATIALAGACATPAPEEVSVATQQRAYGEPDNGFPSWYERVIHMLVNRARVDPVTALAGCTSCADAPCFTQALPPMEWNLNLARAARFHADNLTATGCGMQHDSACDIVANIDQLYPDTCDGATACACVGGVADCNGGGFSSRLGLFGGGGWAAENIAWYGNPMSVFDAWLLESCSDPTCSWGCSGGSGQNGHRWNILGSYGRIGVGGAGGYTVQDFSGGTPTQQIPSGAHYPETGSQIAFRANWWDTNGPVSALVNIEGTCQTMTLERGTSTNGTYLYDGTVGAGCQRYFFLFEDSTNQKVYYPDTGSFGVNCASDWSSNRPAEGAGCSCAPSCGGNVCGDDGCGGSCGSCGAGLNCQGGQCTCADVECNGSCCSAGEVCSAGACCQPDCGTSQCGDDGCGGSCGDCTAPLTCQAGTCDCPPPTTDCGVACIDTNTDPVHCGGCNSPCNATEVCDLGQCDASCSGGLEACNQACVDTETSSEHCGGCDQPCHVYQVCVAGSCEQAGTDAGVADSGPSSDASPSDRSLVSGGCACNAGDSAPPSLLWLLLLALWLRRRDRS